MAQPTEHPTAQLRFVKRHSDPDKALRPQMILQQRWLLWGKDAKASYEWRDVPVAKEGDDESTGQPEA